MTAGFTTSRFVRRLARAARAALGTLAVLVGCCLLFPAVQPALARTAPESAATDDSTASLASGVEASPSTTETSAPPLPGAGPDAPADVRLVFGFTAGTVLVLSALAFLDRRPEP